MINLIEGLVETLRNPRLSYDDFQKNCVLIQNGLDLLMESRGIKQN